MGIRLHFCNLLLSYIYCVPNRQKTNKNKQKKKNSNTNNCVIANNAINIQKTKMTGQATLYMIVNVIIVICGSVAGILILNIALFAPTALLLNFAFDKFSTSNVDTISFAIKLTNFLFNKPIKDKRSDQVAPAPPSAPASREQGVPQTQSIVRSSNLRYHQGMHLYDSSISYKQDRIARLCCINFELHESKIWEDDPLFEYLSKHEKHSFLDVKAKDIRKNNICVQIKSTERVYFFEILLDMYLDFWHETKGVTANLRRKLNDRTYVARRYEIVNRTEMFIQMSAQVFAFGATFILFPIWCLSRMFFLIFPLIVIIDSYEKGNLPGIGSIQFILTIAYWTFCVAWIIAFYKVCQYYFWIHHIAVGGHLSMYKSNANKCFENIVKRYNKLSQVLIVKKIVFGCIGKDIGSIVFDYWVHIEIEDKANNEQKE